MNCSKCGSAVQAGDKFCANCGAPVGVLYCPGCGSQVTAGASFCANCGKSLQPGPKSQAQSAPPAAGAASGSSNISAGDSVLMDTGAFPIAYVKSIMSSINGKLSLTPNDLVFKASVLQGVGKDANKSKEQFSIPLASVTEVERGAVHITVTASGKKYKFGGMTKTKEWETAINNARTRS